jgi:O-antigen/teichoic acid export membrane protein
MIKNNFIYIAMNLVEKGVSFFLLPLYTIYLSPSDLGIISLMSLLIGLVSNFTTSIITILTTRFYYSPKHDIKKILFLSVILLIFKLIFFSFLLFVLNDTIATKYIEDLSLIPIVNLFIIIFVLSSFVRVFMQIFILEKQAKFVAKINVTKAITLLLVTSIFLFNEYGIYAIVYGLIASWSVQLLIILPKIKIYFQPTTEIKLLKEPLKYSYPLIVSTLSNSFIQLGDRYVIKLMLGLSSVGIYSFSYSIAAIVSILLVMPNKMAMQPILLAKEDDPENLKFLVNRYAILYFTFGLVFVLWFSAFSKDLIYLISSNDKFAEGWVIIPIVAFSYLLHGLGNYFNFGMLLANKTYIVSIQTVLVAITNIGLNFLLIPFFGIVGAALATLFSYLLWNYLQRRNSKKYYDMEFELRTFYELSFIGVISISIVYIIDLFNYSFLIKMLLLVLVSTLVIVKYISRKDKIYIYKQIKDKFGK